MERGSGRGVLFQRLSSNSKADSTSPKFLSERGMVSPPSPLSLTLPTSASDEQHLYEAFDPMRDDFEDTKFNSYKEGPGYSLSLEHHVGSRRAQGGCESVRLYIDNIPRKLDKKGVENVLRVFGNVVPGTLIPPKTGNERWDKTWFTFVDLTSFSEAENAVKGLNKKPPYYLRVEFAKPKRQKEVESGDSEYPFYVAPKGESPKPVGIFGRHPKELRRPIEDLLETDAEGYQSGNFSSFRGSVLVTVNNKFMDQSYQTTMGDRVVRGGRMFIQPEISDEILKNVEQSKKPTESDEDDPRIDSPIKLGKCTYCRGPSLRVCAVCQVSYCSTSCTNADSKRHKLKCIPREAKSRGNGSADYVEVTKDEVPFDQTFNPFSLLTKSTLVGANGLGVHLTNGHDADLSNGGSHVQPMHPNDCALFEGDQGDIISRRTEKYEKKIYIRTTPQLEKATTTEHPVPENNSQRFKLSELSAKLKELTLNLEQSAPLPPIPRDTFTKCIIIHSEDNSCSVVPVEKSEKLDGMLYDLLEHFHFDSARPNLDAPAVGALCAVKYSKDNNWYRAVIRSIDESGIAKVKLIDFGTFDFVPARELKALPEEYSSPPPMAIPVILHGPRTSSLNSIVNICPISINEDGVWEMKISGGPECGALASPAVEEKSQKKEIDRLTISSSRYQKVVIVSKEEPGVYWCLTMGGLKKLAEMNETFATIQRHVPHTPEKDQLYLYPFEDGWYRLVWTPPSAFLLDYGRSISVDPKHLQSMPQSIKAIPPLAGRLQLAERTPSKYFDLEVMDTICVKAAGCLGRGVLALVQGESYLPDLLEKFFKERNNSEKKNGNGHLLNFWTENCDPFVIVKREFSDHFCGAIQFGNPANYESYRCLESIARALKGFELIPIDKPAAGQDVIVVVDDDMYRGYVADVEEGPRVVLTDHGVVVTSCQLYRLPSELAAIPVAGVKVQLATPTTHGSVLGSVIPLTNIGGNVGFINADFGAYGKATVTPWVPKLEEIRISAFPLPRSCSANLTAVHSPRAIYLRPKMDDCEAAFDLLLQDVGFACITGKPLERPPSCGELVGAQWSDGNFYRAIIDKKQGDHFQVTFLDFGNCSENVALDKLWRLPDNLKKIPATAVKVGLKGVSGLIFNRAAHEKMNFLLASKSDVRVNHEGDLSEVSLYDEATGENLCESIAELLKPVFRKENADMQPDFFMKSAVVYTYWPSKVTGAVVSVKAHNEFLFISSEGSPFEYIDCVMTPAVTKYCENIDIKRYLPRPNEFVLVRFDTDWYRAIAMPKMENNVPTDIAKVFFVDYGNVGEVLLEDIRPISEEFVRVPAAIKACVVYGLPPAETLMPDQLEKLKELLQGVTEFDLLREEPESDADDVQIPRCCLVWVSSLVSPLADLGVDYKKPHDL